MSLKQVQFLPRLRFLIVLRALPVVAMISCCGGVCTQAEPSSSLEQLTLDVPNDPVSLNCAPPAKDAPVVSRTLRRTFYDDFSNFRLPSRVWEPYGGGGDGRNRSSRTHDDNPNEKQIYVDPEYAGASDHALKLSPFSRAGGALRISASPTPPEFREQLYGRPFTSGMLTTRSFTQRYGYFEIYARFSRVKGAWPAFWLIPAGHWPPEIDVFEGMENDAPDQILVTTHWQDAATQEHQQSYCRAQAASPDQMFHRYGVLWLPNRIVHYLDLRPVNEIQTPPGVDLPMYMIANLAVTPNADEDASVPITFDIGWIAVYSINR
jgi:hypothetical protein